MGYRVLTDGTIAADTLDEAIALQRRIRETDSVPAPKRPMGSGTVGLTKTGTFRIRLRTQDGGRINRGGFRSRGEAEAALAEVVVAGAAPPPRRRRRQRCSACLEPGHIARKCPVAPAEEPPPPAPAYEDLSLYEAALVPDHAPMFPAWQDDPPRVGDVDRPAPPAAICAETPTPVQVAAPAAGDWRKSTAFRERVAAGMRARWARRRAARAAASNESPKEEVTPARATESLVFQADPATCAKSQTDLSCLTDSATADATTEPDDDAPPLRKAQRRCSRCGIPGHRASTCDVQPLTRDERRMAIEAWATRRRAPAAAADPPPTPAPPPLVCRTFTADEDFSEFLPDEITEPPEPAGAVGAPLPPTPATALPAPADHPQVIDPTRLLIRRTGLAKTVSADRPLTAGEIAAGADLETPIDVMRPITRGDCVDADRPCPFVSCSHHLFLDVDDDGALKLNFPHLDPDQLTETCALDVADQGGGTLEVVGQLLGVTRERIRQIEAFALRQLAARGGDFEAAPVRGSSAPEDSVF